MTVTKADIVKHLTEKHQINKKLASDVLETFLEVVKRDLIRGKSVSFKDLGKLTLRDKHERAGRNPQTGGPLSIAPRRVVKFKVSNLLSKKLRKRYEQIND